MRGHFTTLYSRHHSLFPLYFDMYHEGLFNVLLVSSTWLTVVMAVGRYVAVCKPLHARGFISVRGTRIAIASVFVGSILFNLPRFWHYEALSMPCGDLLPPAGRPPSADVCPSCRYYIKHTGPLYDNPTFVAVYGVACSAVAILLPLPVLTVCNVCLARALRRSRLLQKHCSVPARDHNCCPRDHGSSRVTTVPVHVTVLCHMTKVLARVIVVVLLANLVGSLMQSWFTT